MKYYIIAGEASGDLHGSNLMRGLYAKDPDADIRFWGGEKMAEVYRAHQQGTGWVQDYRNAAVMGLVEVLRKGVFLLRRVAFCRRDIAAWQPDAVGISDSFARSLWLPQRVFNRYPRRGHPHLGVPQLSGI